MTHKIRALTKDYVEKKPSTTWIGPSVTCGGFQVDIDGYGYNVKHCHSVIKSGDEVFFRRDCECKADIGPFCSVACGWYECERCDRKVCNNCYRYKKKGYHCTYCSHKHDGCGCENNEYCVFTSDEESLSSTEEEEEDDLTRMEAEMTETKKRIAESQANTRYLEAILKEKGRSLKRKRQEALRDALPMAGKVPRSLHVEK